MTLEQLDSRLEGFVSEPYSRPDPGILWHYTSYEVALAIIQNREFWATSHACTNDPAELRGRDEAVLQIAAEVVRSADPIASELGRLICENYEPMSASRFVPVYLACFTTVSDGDVQWGYGDGGRGVGLGFQFGDASFPEMAGLGSSMTQVDYSAASARERVAGQFEKILGSLREFGPLTDLKPLELVLSALYRSAALANITSKGKKWSGEAEWRRVALFRKGAQAVPKWRTRDGQRVEYVHLPISGPDEPLPLVEVQLGPNCEKAVETVRHDLAHIVPVHDADIAVTRSALRPGPFLRPTA